MNVRQLPPSQRTPLHRCAHPVRHSLEALGLATMWCAFSLWECMGLAQQVRSVYLSAMGLPPTWESLGTELLIWGLTAVAYFVWLAVGVVGGTIMAYVFWMAGCNRALERVAHWQQQARAHQRTHHDKPVVAERVYLSAEEAARHGIAGPVVLERLSPREEC